MCISGCHAPARTNHQPHADMTHSLQVKQELEAAGYAVKVEINRGFAFAVEKSGSSDGSSTGNMQSMSFGRGASSLGSTTASSLSTSAASPDDGPVITGSAGSSTTGTSPVPGITSSTPSSPDLGPSTDISFLSGAADFDSQGRSTAGSSSGSSKGSQPTWGMQRPSVQAQSLATRKAVSMLASIPGVLQVRPDKAISLLQSPEPQQSSTPVPDDEQQPPEDDHQAVPAAGQQQVRQQAVCGSSSLDAATVSGSDVEYTPYGVRKVQALDPVIVNASKTAASKVRAAGAYGCITRANALSSAATGHVRC